LRKYFQHSAQQSTDYAPVLATSAKFSCKPTQQKFVEIKTRKTMCQRRPNLQTKEAVLMIQPSRTDAHMPAWLNYDFMVRES